MSYTNGYHLYGIIHRIVSNMKRKLSTTFLRSINADTTAVKGAEARVSTVSNFQSDITPEVCLAVSIHENNETLTLKALP